MIENPLAAQAWEAMRALSQLDDEYTSLLILARELVRRAEPKGFKGKTVKDWRKKQRHFLARLETLPKLYSFKTRRPSL